MKIFKHLEEHNLSYIEHLSRAWTIGLNMIFGGCCAMIHGLIPCVHQNTATTMIKEMFKEFSDQKDEKEN